MKRRPMQLSMLTLMQSEVTPSVLDNIQYHLVFHEVDEEGNITHLVMEHGDRLCGSPAEEE